MFIIFLKGITIRDNAISIGNNTPISIIN
ncbi:hypothetical protein CY0110_15777 [Crocosphaera chwakensis CCY0110]|uniref:Uncharacterized protein n=1 Tax=Crocosphaera chwakensis CCY0110 TaxID=391612 RepID=A3IHI7_9CHRO|nr:hypothetical protein CY0110_15777 [Crocosphaera chwakensis CCY0110]